VNNMTHAECQVATIQHIEQVRHFIKIITDKLTNRGIKHDKCKLESPELEIFTEYTPKLAESEYGSEEYNQNLKEMQKALDHHYANCRHHPEHFEKGIDDMNLVDIVEMLCDWKAASMRQLNGNLLKSIEQNAKRFNYDDQLKHILINTAKLLDESQHE